MLSRDLLEFIRGCIRSVWAVELLLLLRRRRGEALSADDLVRELRASAALVAENLQCFQASGLVQEPEPGRYTYAPAAPALESLCDELEREYRSRPVTLVNAIVAGHKSSVQGLADAFRFKGDGK